MREQRYRRCASQDGNEGSKEIRCEGSKSTQRQEFYARNERFFQQEAKGFLC